jgi:AAA15 family ATPase/GTPase
MLIRFVVSNFLSFDEEREFNMIAGNFKTHKHHVYSLPKLNVLKAAAIYGANGAGKSNMIKSIYYLQDLVSEGEVHKSVNDSKFKLNKKNASLPVSFEIEFFSHGKTYSYGLSINHTSIVEEWLYETGITKDDKLVFERKLVKGNKTVIRVADKYAKTEKQKLLIELMQENLLKQNELLVSKWETLKIRELVIFRDWIIQDLLIIFPHSKFTGLVPELSRSEHFRNFANNLLQTFDTGVKSLGIESISFDKFFGQRGEDLKDEIMDSFENGEVLVDSEIGPVLVVKEEDNFIVKKLISTHSDDAGKDVHFDLNEESDGTQRILDFIPAFNNVVHSSSTVIIDEIDQSLHPVLLKALVEKTMADDQTKGQLIFTTHESNLLDLETFRQDEVWFVEKDQKLGSSQMYSLSDFKPRYDLDIKKGYLKGRFGAIPFLANLESLNWQECDA